jgi:hypothetical protein
MDEKTRERVHAIAKSLKELHLAASMDEAMKRAREIVESAQANGKSVKQLMSDIAGEAKEQSKAAGRIQKESDKARDELGGEASEHRKQIEKNLKSAKSDKAAAGLTGEQVRHDIKVHKLEKGGVKDALQEVDELECAAEDAGYIVKEAEKIQKSKKEKK